MVMVRIKVPIGEGTEITLSIPSDFSVLDLEDTISNKLGIKSSNMDLRAYKSGESGLMFTVFPNELVGGVDEELLMDEWAFLRHQFPLVQMISLTTYEGMVRCEGGPIKELAEDGTWPFDQYVNWHKFRIKLSYLHPYKPPTVTWLTDIDHPNIIPNRKGKVCVSLLGKGWLPQTKLAAVINSLYFLLYDPNPYSHYPNKRCTRAADVCKKFGFPRKRGGALSRHENTVTCPMCRRPFIIEDPDSRIIQCIHCKIILKRRRDEEEY
jgi:hypothetical protein